jgi:hypothetical protein
MFDSAFEGVPHQDKSGQAERPVQRLKHWIERRLSERRLTNAPALVLQGTRVQTGILSDVSENGFGLNKVTGLVIDEAISVATPEGTVLEGLVVWAKDGRAGARLMKKTA